MRLRRFSPLSSGFGLDAARRLDEGADRCGGPAACHPRRVSLTLGGYSRLWLDGRSVYAHRVACELAHGPAPAGRPNVLHRCDTPACVNPAHLRWGSHVENMGDMCARGRQAAGERRPGAKLSAFVVDLLRSSALQGRELAALFGVSESTISEARRGVRWGAALCAGEGLPR